MAVHDDDATADALFSAINARRGVMHTTPTRNRLGPVPPRHRPWYRQPVMIFAAAVIATILVATPLLMLRSNPTGEAADGPVASDTTVTVEVTTVPATPATTVPPDPDTGQRVGTEVTDTLVYLTDIATTKTGLIAAGFEQGDDYLKHGVVLTSDDGVTWTRLATDDPVLTSGGAVIHGITETEAGLTAVGSSCDDVSFPCDSAPYPTIWTSTDGTRWTETFIDSDGPGEIGKVIDTAFGMVAAGYVTRLIDGPSDPGTVLTSPAVWLGSAESGWNRVWEGEPVETDEYPPEVNRIISLAESPDGLIVGAGSTRNDSGERVAAVWFSTDGYVWETAEAAPSVFGSASGREVAMIDVAYGPSGFVAVGHEDRSEIAVWQSPDGRTWSRVATADQPDATTGVLGAVAPIDSGWVAAGYGSENGAGPVAIWASPDATTWNRVSTLDTGYATTLTAIGDRIVLAGGMIEADQVHAAIWIAQIGDP